MQHKLLSLLVGLLVAMLLVLLVSSCAPGGAANTSSTPKPIASGGLGLTQTEWEQHHTRYQSNAPEAGSNYFFYDVRGQVGGAGYFVYYWREWNQEDPNARISVIDVNINALDPRLVPTNAPNLEARGQAIARTLLPLDAQLVSGRKIDGGGQRSTEVYHSESLKGLYPPLASLPPAQAHNSSGAISVVYFNADGITITAEDAGKPPLPDPTSTSIPVNTVQPTPHIPPVPTQLVIRPSVPPGPGTIPYPIPSRPARIP